MHQGRCEMGSKVPTYIAVGTFEVLIQLLYRAVIPVEILHAPTVKKNPFDLVGVRGAKILSTYDV